MFGFPRVGGHTGSSGRGGGGFGFGFGLGAGSGRFMIGLMGLGGPSRDERTGAGGD